MTNANSFTFTDPAQSAATAEVVGRFIAAFQHKDPARVRDLVAPDCVMEAIQPAPDGLRVEGYEANVAFWEAMVADPNGSFEVEDVVISGDRAINRWRYRFGAGAGSSVRGVTLIQVRDGKIAEALAYAKTPLIADLGQGG
jgi:ketosteroid isomerase-like protein